MKTYQTPFLNREQAAELLAGELMRYKNQNPILIGVPRGAVPMTQKIAGLLDAEWDVVLVHKISSPFNSEYAIGAVSEEGSIYSPQQYELPLLGFDLKSWIKQEAETELQRLKSRRATIESYRRRVPLADRTVIMIDDGIATGSTLIAAVRSIKEQSPARIIVAAPVASQSAVELFRHEGVELVILNVPQSFYSVSQFYEEFPQVSDEQFINIMKNSTDQAA